MKRDSPQNGSDQRCRYEYQQSGVLQDQHPPRSLLKGSEAWKSQQDNAAQLPWFSFKDGMHTIHIF